MDECKPLNAGGQTPHDTLQPDQLRLLARTREAVAGKVERHSRHTARKSAREVVSESGESGESGSESERSSGGGSEGERNPDSYRALYSARKV